MATLHVRNVPDELYEELRATAERDGRSIGAEAITLLRGALLERSRLYEGVQQTFARGKSAFAQRLAERAKDLVARSQDICREVGSVEVTPAHVMLAMLEDDLLRSTLERRGITEQAVRAVLPSGPPREGPAPLSAETRRMLEQALLQTLEL
ncbi:MAG: FitA-like ribbon-helix-helix domain-containing protein [Gaiellaceae bacterium]